MPLLGTLLDLLYPQRCEGCGRFGFSLCAACAARLPAFPREECVACRTPSAAGRTCQRCRSVTPLDGMVIALQYEHPLVAQSVHRLKYNFQEHRAAVLGAFLANALRRARIDPAVPLVPVPLHPRRQRERGFNQAMLLARACAAGTNRAVLPLLARARPTAVQAQLDLHHRLQNLAGAFRCTAHLEPVPKSVMLVDDVVTTGSTLAACAATLKSAGVDSVWGLAVARGELRLLHTKQENESIPRV